MTTEAEAEAERGEAARRRAADVEDGGRDHERKSAGDFSKLDKAGRRTPETPDFRAPDLPSREVGKAHGARPLVGGPLLHGRRKPRRHRTRGSSKASASCLLRASSPSLPPAVTCVRLSFPCSPSRRLTPRRLSGCHPSDVFLKRAPFFIRPVLHFWQTCD